MFREKLIIILLITINTINSIISSPLINIDSLTNNLTYDGRQYSLYRSSETAFYYSNSSSDLIFLMNHELKTNGWNVDHYGLQYSAYAVKDSRIYSFGGYGFWHQNNVLRYFDFNDGWIPLILDGNALIEPCHSSVMFAAENGLIIIGGKRASLENPLISEDVLNWYHIDLDGRKVTKSILEYPINANNLLGITNDSIFWLMENGIIGMFTASSDTYYMLEKNELYLKFFKDKSYKFRSGKIISSNNMIELNKAFKFKKIERNFSKNIGLALFGVIVLAFGLIIRKKKSELNSCAFEENSLKSLTTNHFKFLQVLLTEGPQTGTQVLSFLDLGHSSMSNLFKKRRDFIQEVNLLADFYLIVEKKSQDDSRSKVFQINDNLSDACILHLRSIVANKLKH